MMTFKIWRDLLDEKNRLHAQLFLLLNAFASFLGLATPLYATPRVTHTGLIILATSIGLLLWLKRYPKKRLNINVAGLIFGLLWAMHVTLRYAQLNHAPSSFAVIALMSLLFIGALALNDNLRAFILFCTPVAVTLLWLDKGEHFTRLVYCVAVPLVGIGIQHVISRRNARFILALITQLQNEKDALNDISMLDPLTGLYNRRGLASRLEDLRQQGTENALLLLDIDHFKSYNDHQGHSLGDRTLVHVARAIRDSVRPQDIVVRYGGEEFLVLLVGMPLYEARIWAEKIRQQVHQLHIPHPHNNQADRCITLSAGVACDSNQPFEQTVLLADTALYQAKKTGRNRVVVIGDILIEQ